MRLSSKTIILLRCRVYLKHTQFSATARSRSKCFFYVNHFQNMIAKNHRVYDRGKIAIEIIQ
jgi:hypothetical protein